MSALSLQYPYKPNTLADDLESFIHVVTYNCLRFHYHDRTTVGTRGLLPNVLAATNGENEVIADFVSDFFDKCITDGNNYVGGALKLSSNRSGEPGFTLPDPISPHLPNLVENLYAQLKEFYASYDRNEYQQYRPHRQPLHVASRNPQMLPKPSPRVVRRAPEPEKPAGVARPPKSDVFDSHDRIVGVFKDVYEALMTERAKQKEQDGKTPTLEDKTDDQFLGLPSFVLIHPKNISPSKRHYDLGGDLPAKRSKTDESGGIGLGLESIPEVHEHQ